jgi:hypothetical protein
MWRACPDAKAVPDVRVAYADEREIQHATDAGAMVVVIPTVRNLEEGTAGRNWTYFPPPGKRSTGGGQAFELYGNVPGGYRNTFNDSVVLIEMIETLDGVKESARAVLSHGATGRISRASRTAAKPPRSRVALPPSCARSKILKRSPKWGRGRQRSNKFHNTFICHPARPAAGLRLGVYLIPVKFNSDLIGASWLCS